MHCYNFEIASKMFCNSPILFLKNFSLFLCLTISFCLKNDEQDNCVYLKYIPRFFQINLLPHCEIQKLLKQDSILCIERFQIFRQISCITHIYFVSTIFNIDFSIF